MTKIGFRVEKRDHRRIHCAGHNCTVEAASQAKAVIHITDQSTLVTKKRDKCNKGGGIVNGLTALIEGFYLLQNKRSI